MKTTTQEYRFERGDFRRAIRAVLLVAGVTAGFALGGASVARAQADALLRAVDSPIKMQPQSYAANEAVKCSLPLPASAALFGTDTKGAVSTGGGSCEIITNELFSPFRVFRTDCTLTPLSTWSSAGIVGLTVTGIAFPNAGAGTYWQVDPFGGAVITEFTTGTGVPTGNNLPTPAGGSVWGSLVFDDNLPGEILCINEIALDATTCIDANAGGVVVCTYPNSDNSGGAGAFGNGTGDAVNPGDCSGQTLVNASGTITEAQVTRVGQYDCTGADPACADRWSTAVTASTFINGVEEFPYHSDRALVAIDNVTSVIFILSQPVGIADCQDIDADMDVVWVNGSQGGGGFVVNVNVNATLAVAVRKTSAGNGRFIHHMNAGIPNSSTVGALFDLGNRCFPFLGGSPAVIENNVGKTGLVGASNYFGAAISDPAKAPTFLASLLQPAIDVTNLPAGVSFTHQLIAVNSASSSAKGGSLSNAVVMTMN